jgi:drug/metabolite transporter (DMT)-like permease
MAILLTIYILSHAASGLTLKYLAVLGLPPAQVLVFRGLGCLLAAGVWSLHYRRALWPKEPRSQLIRIVVSGLSLFLITASYRYANATTVSIVQRMDIALLILLSPLVGEPTARRQKVFAILVLAAFFAFALGSQGPGEGALGYALAFVGTLGVTFGFILIKNSSRKETEGVIAAVAGFAILLYGLLGSAAAGPWVSTPRALVTGLGAGVLMFLIYLLTIRLYRVMDVAKAEYPTLFAVLLIAPAEYWLLGAQFDPRYLAFLVLSLFTLGGILRAKPAPGL